MKTILFFDRSHLTDLYILLTKELQGKANIMHVAFSEKEKRKLESAGIVDYIDYHTELSRLIDSLIPSKELLQEIDETILVQSKGQFSLNASIQSDRGYALLNYEEVQLLVCCHYTLWKRIFSKHHVDIMYHELASQFMTHIAGILCKQQGGKFIYQTQLQGENSGYFYLNLDGEDFSCEEIESKYIYYKQHPEEIDIDRCKSFVNKFRMDYNVAFGNLIKPSSNILSLINGATKAKAVEIKNRRRFDRIKDNIDYWLIRNNNQANKLWNMFQYHLSGIKFSSPVPEDKYFYYSIHLEPEATVLYLGGGFYTNQIKLIENISASIPSGYYLYVKDHPHEYAYRKADDYERLLKIPNVRLIDQRIPGKQLIKNAVGVFSIVGTAGFEALMLDKQSYCFGRTYYTTSPRVNYVENIRDLRSIIYENMGKAYEDDIELYTYVYSYLMSLHKGFVTYFGRERVLNSGINEEENAKMISSDILGGLNY